MPKHFVRNSIIVCAVVILSRLLLDASGANRWLSILGSLGAAVWVSMWLERGVRRG